MGCYRCDAVQTDPTKGASPWVRLVIKGEQLLLCPPCQSKDPEWTSAGDRCPDCASPRLAVVMDSVVCRACGKDFERAGFR